MKKNGDQLRSLVSQKGSRIEFAVWSSACTPIHRFSPAIPPPLFSLVPVPPLLRIRKYRFPEDVGKKFQGSSSSRRILPLEIITSERSSIIGSNREMQWIMIQETMWRKWRANDSLKCWSVWKKDAGVAWFYFPPFFFFFFSYTFFPAAIFPPLEEFSLSIHFARRICETRQYMRHRVTLRMSIRAFSIFLPCLSSPPCSIYSCIFFFFWNSHFSLWNAQDAMCRCIVKRLCKGSITLVTIFLNHFRAFSRVSLNQYLLYDYLFMLQIHPCLLYVSAVSLFLSLLPYRIRSPFYFPFSRNETIYIDTFVLISVKNETRWEI